MRWRRVIGAHLGALCRIQDRNLQVEGESRSIKKLRVLLHGVPGLQVEVRNYPSPPRRELHFRVASRYR